MSIILDVIVLGIVLLCVILSAKKGFAKSIIEVSGFVAAVILAISVSGPLAEITYDKVIEPSVIKVAEESSAAADQNIQDNISLISDKIWESLPDFVKNNSADINQNNILNSVNIDTSDTVTSVAEKVSQTVAKPVVSKMLSALYAVIILVVLLILVKFLAKLINPLFNFSVIGKLNRTLGGVLGLLKGILISAVFCAAVSLIISFTKEGFLCFTSESVENSFIVSRIISVLPFLK